MATTIKKMIFAGGVHRHLTPTGGGAGRECARRGATGTGCGAAGFLRAIRDACNGGEAPRAIGRALVLERLTQWIDSRPARTAARRAARPLAGMGGRGRTGERETLEWVLALL